MESTVPRHLGPYQVLSEMARGGSGIVLECRHERTGTIVAVKTARETGRLHRAFLRKEIAMLSRLGLAHNDGVVAVLDNGLDGGLPWYAMEFIEGADAAWLTRKLWRDGWPDRLDGAFLEPLEELETRLEVPGRQAASTNPTNVARPAPVSRPAAAGHLDRVLELVGRVADILAFVHSEGIVHGDLTPRNVLLRRNGRPVLVDFGTALHVFSDGVSREVAQVEGLLHGTPGYMAPEQIRGEPLDARCDLYALGCIFYELVTSQPVFRALDGVILRNQHLFGVIQPPSALVQGVSPELDALILGLLAKQPEQRIGYADEVSARVAMLRAEPPTSRPASRAAHLYRPRLVGRQVPLQRLVSFLRDAENGHGGCVFISGESGIGKTRLLNELGSRALRQKMELVLGRCFDLSQTDDGKAGIEGPAFQPFIPALQRVADTCHLAQGEVLRRRLAEVLPILAPYEPTLASVDAGVAPPLELEPDLARARVLRALSEALKIFADERPLLVVLDDLQWADELTLAFLKSCQSGILLGSRVLIVGSTRAEHARPAVEQLIAAEPERHLALTRLEREDVAAIIRDSVASDEVPPAWSEALQQHSEGNPFFVAEYLRAAAEQGAFTRDSTGAWVPPRSFPGGGDLPVSLRRSIDQRMQGLSAGSREVLKLVSVLGREFDSDWLVAYTGTGDVLDGDMALEELCARRILEEPAPAHFRFVHDKIREACEAAISPELRADLHGRAARYLEAVAARAPAAAPLDAVLGSHWAKAGQPGRAFDYLMKAARHAEGLHANSQAIQLYLLALEQADALGWRREPEWAARLRDLEEPLGDLFQSSARHDEARARYLAVSASLSADEREARARLARKIANTFWKEHDYPRSLQALDQAESCLGASEELTTATAALEWIEIQRSRFFTFYFDRQVGRLPPLIRAVSPVIEQHGTPSHRYFLYQSMAMGAMAASGYRYSTDAVALANRALAQVTGDPRHLRDWYDGRFTVGLVRLMGGPDECAEAVALLATLAQEMEQIGDALLESRVLTYLAIAHRRLGDTEAVRSAALAALRAAELASQWQYIGAARACLAWVDWRTGQRAAAASMAETARADWRKTVHDFPFHWLATLVLLDLARADESNESMPTLRGLVSDLLARGQQMFAEPIQTALASASAACEAGEPRATLATVDRFLALVAQAGYL